MEKEKFWRIPAGVRDWLPGERASRRQLEEIMTRTFALWGYREVATPTLEYWDSISLGLNDEGREVIKLIDRNGDILVLRPDWTTPIARLTASRLAQWPLPLRLFYSGQVFTQVEPQVGRWREYGQAGVELIGLPGGWADGEVVALAAESLLAAGLKEFQLHLGHMGLLQGLMAEQGLTPEQEREVKAAVSRKDLVRAEQLLGRGAELLTLRGGREMLVRAEQLTRGPEAAQALAELGETMDYLEAYGLAERIVLDFSLLRGLDYYTGVIFEGFAPGLGFSLCGGGRYDGLLARFGQPLPATGFAIGYERLLLALERQGVNRQGMDTEVRLQRREKNWTEVLAEARRRRAAGEIVIVEG
ncbi:MAG: ATP phosphoribosyltransferase regulatory subunit [Bacillota bacterium]